MNIQIINPEPFVRYNREVCIKELDPEGLSLRLFNSYGEALTIAEGKLLHQLSDDEIQDELNQNRDLLSLALEQELVYIRNLEGNSFLQYVESFN